MATKHTPQIDELLRDLQTGKRCEVCDSLMIHTRLRGYQCPRGCERLIKEQTWGERLREINHERASCG